MQSKEKKWIEVEQVLKYYIEEDDELRDRFKELKLIVNGDTKLTSVVGENDKLKRELAKAYRKNDKLRSKILDPFYRLKNKGTNEYMFEKPKVKKPPNVIVTADDIIRVDEALMPGTCYVPKFDEDELLTEYQADKNRVAKEEKQKAAALAARKRAHKAELDKLAAYYKKIENEGVIDKDLKAAVAGTSAAANAATATSTGLGKTTQIRTDALNGERLIPAIGNESTHDNG